MADFNCHLKKSKILVFFTIFAFLYMSCFTSCSKSGKKEKEEVARVAENAAKAAATAGKGLAIAELQSAKESGKERPVSQDDLKKATEKLEAYFQALEEAAKAMPRDKFDPQAILEKIGKDYAALFLWVQRNTSFIPYQGVLRGPVGVLMERRGNSLDRALLLYEILRLAGYEVKLARGKLSEDQAKNILATGRELAEKEILPQTKISANDMGEIIRPYVNKYQLDKNRILQVVNRYRADKDDLFEKIRTRVSDQTRRITQFLEESDIKSGLGKDSSRYSLIQDHWWVQMKQDEGWLDLDVSVDQPTPGKKLVAADEKVASQDLPEDLYHRIIIRVMVEQSTESGLSESVVLEIPLKARDLIGKQIILRHIPMNWPQEGSLFNEDDPIGKIKNLAANEKEWLPVFVIGSEEIAQSSFLDTGEVNKNPGRKRRAAGPGGLAGGMFNALAGGEGEKKTEKSSCLTAEWIEYEIISPGFPANRIRRQVFDLLGPNARLGNQKADPETVESRRLERALTLLGETEIAAIVCRLSTDFLAWTLADKLIANKEILMSLLCSSNLYSPSQINEAIEKIIPFPGLEYSLAMVRDMGSLHRAAIFLSQPNILAFHKYPRLDPNGEVSFCQALDIVNNEISLVPETKNPLFVALEQGVLDTNSEAFLLDPCGKAENTAQIFAELDSKKVEWRLLNDINDPELKNLGLSPDVLARIGQELSEGYVVFAPRIGRGGGSSPPVGWWRVNPLTGNILGIGERGWGQGSTEYVKIIRAVLKMIMPAILCGIIKGHQAGKPGATGGQQAEAIIIIMSCIAGGGLSMVGMLLPNLALGQILQLIGDIISYSLSGYSVITYFIDEG
jgi:hypothetical protein